MICPVNNRDLMAMINCQLQKAHKKSNVGEVTVLKSVTHGESLFQNFALKNSAENLAAVISFCTEYQISISNYVDHGKRAIKDISISIADALFELKFNFTLPNLLVLTKHLVDNEMSADIVQPTNNILNIKQAAVELSMSVQTLRNRAKKGEIPVFGKSVKGYRFEKTVLLEWGRNYRNK
ncbi:helix-turn-helix domain-containing protein [Ferruginibacter sp. SUN106]|uniref:helix-turn-helix domain-containing protein n=1 Tax=Ferruginibacter sp. SUN106 TaxID=2978348 RepID=UPI003D36CA12